MTREQFNSLVLGENVRGRMSGDIYRVREIRLKPRVVTVASLEEGHRGHITAKTISAWDLIPADKPTGNKQ